LAEADSDTAPPPKDRGKIDGQRHDWAQAGCVFCRLDDSPVVLSRASHQIRRCRRCSVMWCDPMRLSLDFGADDEEAYIEVESTISEENAGRLELLAQLAPPTTHPQVLEVGSMHGNFVRQMRDTGYEGVGLDLSDSAVKDAERINPGCVRYGTLDSEVPTSSIDVVAAFNVIEHMDAPHEFLDDVSRVLRPGGVLILETPAKESLYHYAMFGVGRLRPKTEHVEVGLKPGTHIFKFGRRAWAQILLDREFEVLASKPKSTPLTELLKKKRESPLVVRAGIVTVGLAARVTNLHNRIVVVARRN